MLHKQPTEEKNKQEQPSNVNQNDENEEKKKENDEDLDEVWEDDCDIHDVFNGYVYGAQILDCRGADKYALSHIHKSINVQITNPQKSVIQQSKKIIVVNDDNNNKNEMQYLFGYCKNYLSCGSFRCTKAGFKYNELAENFKFICCSNEEESQMKSDRKKYPNVIIANKLYLGDQWDRKNVDRLLELGITHIVDITEAKFETSDSFKIFKIKLQDVPSANIQIYFDSAVKFIDDALSLNDNNRVFVHCQMGISRSTTITLAYLMKIKKMTLLEGYQLCQRSRPRIRPNDGFFQKLSFYEESIYGKTTKHEVDKLGLREKQECIIM